MVNNWIKNIIIIIIIIIIINCAATFLWSFSQLEVTENLYKWNYWGKVWLHAGTGYGLQERKFHNFCTKINGATGHSQNNLQSLKVPF